jgi:hypothetical protein
MMLILISEAISNSNAVIRRKFRKLRFQMIDDNSSNCPARVEGEKRLRSATRKP